MGIAGEVAQEQRHRIDPHSLDLVALNAGSNDLTLIRGINLGDDEEQTISSGGLFPSSAVMGDFGGSLGLLVANNGDGRPALFLAGPDGLALAADFTQEDLPHPTSLVMDSLGTIYSSTEGIESAVQVLLDVAPEFAAGGLTGLLETAQRPEERLVSFIVALTASGESFDSEGPVPTQDLFPETAVAATGLANQPLPNPDHQDELSLSSWDAEEPTLTAREEIEAGRDPVAWVVAGLDEAFHHASVTSLAAPTAAAAAAIDPETSELVASAETSDAGADITVEAASRSRAAEAEETGENAAPESLVQPLVLPESSLVAPKLQTGSEEIWIRGKVFAFVMAGAAASGLGWLLSERMRPGSRLHSLARLLSSRLSPLRVTSRGTSTL